MAGFFIKTFLSRNGIYKALEKLNEEEHKLPRTIEKEIESALKKKFPEKELGYLIEFYSAEIATLQKDLYKKYSHRISQRIARLNNLIADFPK